jgi:kinesin family protein 1
MLLKLSKAGGGGGPVDLKELGLTNLGEVIENMTENEKIMDDMQKPWEEKLAEAKAKSGKADAGDGEEQKFDDLVTEKQKAAEEKDDEEETAEDEHKASRRLSMKKRRITNTLSEDRTVPHLTNLHEDPQLSGCVFYSLAKGEIHIGRITGEPMPEILLGAVGIKPNHAKIKLLDNGLFELSVCDADAATNTMVNGKNMPKKRVRLLNHLDRIAFAGGIIYVFYYPLLNLHTKKVM